MATWREVEAAAPELAALVRERFDAHLHKTMATIRKDGSPRISGTEVKFADGGVWIGSMGGAMKARDLQRDGRCACHSAPLDTDMVEADAKIAGIATEVSDIDRLRRVWPEWEEHHAPGGAVSPVDARGNGRGVHGRQSVGEIEGQVGIAVEHLIGPFAGEHHREAGALDGSGQ